MSVQPIREVSSVPIICCGEGEERSKGSDRFGGPIVTSIGATSGAG